MYKSFLIKYAEIAIKGKNRYLFEDALVSNIRHQLNLWTEILRYERKTDVSMWIRKGSMIMTRP